MYIIVIIIKTFQRKRERERESYTAAVATRGQTDSQTILENSTTQHAQRSTAIVPNTLVGFASAQLNFFFFAKNYLKTYIHRIIIEGSCNLYFYKHTRYAYIIS